MPSKPLPGSTPILRPGVHRWHSRCDSAERIRLTVVLHRANPLPEGFHRTHLDHATFAERHGANHAHVADVVEWLQSVGLDVCDVLPHARRITVEGWTAKIEAAFGVETHVYSQYNVPMFRSHKEPVSLPEKLHGKVMAVLGLDTRKIARPYMRQRKPWEFFPTGYFPWEKSRTATDSVTVPPGNFEPLRIAKLYGFPEPAPAGHGQAIAIVELGGALSASDVKTYFPALGIISPSTAIVSVDGARPKSDGPDGADGEVMLDFEVAGCIAPHATLVGYFANNTDQGFCDAISQAAHDQHYRPGVISISWGSAESNWTASAIQAMEAALQDAAALGITVTVASGDNGSSDGMDDGEPHVDYPASSQWVLACGGTRLVRNGNAIGSETVWNDGTRGGATGGGYSSLFPVPDWQRDVYARANGPGGGLSGMRGVPDVAGNADPASAYVVLVDGNWMSMGGTSACAPLYAALFTLLNQINGKRAGFVNPTLYAATSGIRDITEGSNGAYSAGPGWDACTGLGVLAPSGGQP